MHGRDRVTPDELHRLYVVERQSLAEIARPLGVSKALVGKWLRADGISARTISEGTSIAQKGRPLTEAHKAALRVSAANARAKITAASHRKQAEKMRGRTPPNKGKPWTPEQRAKHMATRATAEYKENLSASLRGEKSYNWKGGASVDGLSGWRWRKRRIEAYERDNYTCRDCGCKCLNARDSKKHPKRKIQAHHIVSRRNGGTDELENLVTLCMSCHHKRERKE